MKVENVFLPINFTAAVSSAVPLCLHVLCICVRLGAATWCVATEAFGDQASQFENCFFGESLTQMLLEQGG